MVLYCFSLITVLTFTAIRIFSIIAEMVEEVISEDDSPSTLKSEFNRITILCNSLKGEIIIFSGITFPILAIIFVLIIAALLQVI